jgi:hypothetical protein
MSSQTKARELQFTSKTVTCALLSILFPTFLFPETLLARDAREQQRIDYLIQSLSSLKGAAFIRNGKEYDAQAIICKKNSTSSENESGQLKTSSNTARPNHR